MKIVRAADNLVLHLAKREHQLLLDLLRLYPCIPAARQRKRSPGIPESSQRLLDEALAEQRASNKKRIQQWLAAPRRFEKVENQFRMNLSGAEVEWMIQVLNDVRVGSWISLGSPEARMELAALNEETAPHFWAMEMSGHFQMALLHALEAKP